MCKSGPFAQVPNHCAGCRGTPKHLPVYHEIRVFLYSSPPFQFWTRILPCADHRGVLSTQNGTSRRLCKQSVAGVRERAKCSTTPRNLGTLRFVCTILSVGPAPGPAVDQPCFLLFCLPKSGPHAEVAGKRACGQGTCNTWAYTIESGFS